MARMTDDELRTIIDQEIHASHAYCTGDLARQRTQALEYYLGEPFGNEEEGRSQVVSTDVADTVEWMLPSLIKIFTASDKAVEFEPNGAEDVKGAEQATDAANYVFYRQNPGFLILYEWFKDALVQKNGIVKYWWEKKQDVTKESYAGLTDEQMVMLAMNQDIEILEHTAYPDEPQGSQPAVDVMMGLAPAPMLHDVKLKLVDDKSCIKIACVPPEEFLITRKHNSLTLQDCLFCAHRVRYTLSELIEMGFKKKELEDISSENPLLYDQEYQARRVFGEDFFDSDSNDPSRREVWVNECYIRVDYDDDGIAELRKIMIAGDKILENEEADHVPFAAITPIIMTHRFFGQSVAEIVMDLQLIKSTLWRQALDNIYLTNNPRMEAVKGQVNLDDLLTVRPGGIVRVDQPGMIKPIVVPFVAQHSFPMLEYADQQRLNRSGVNYLSSGQDSDAINKTARGAQLADNRMEERTQLVARVFAETGVKDLFKGILHLLAKYQDKPMMIRLRKEFVPVDPREWSDSMDMTVNVGLGTGNKDQQLVHLQAIAMAQQTAIQMGGIDQLVTLKNVYNVQAKIAENAGFKDVDELWTDPETVEKPPPPPNPEMERVKIDGEAKKAELELKRQEMGANIQLKREEMQAKLMMQRQEQEQNQLLQREQLGQQREIEGAKLGFQSQQHSDTMAMQGESEDMTKATELLQSVAQEQSQAVQAMAEATKAMQEVAQAMGQAVKVMAAPRRTKLMKDPKTGAKYADSEIVQH